MQHHSAQERSSDSDLGNSELKGHRYGLWLIESQISLYADSSKVPASLWRDRDMLQRRLSKLGQQESGNEDWEFNR